MENNEIITLEVARKLGLLPQEFNRIFDILGRQPNYFELIVYSVMWSEHCSYKNSIIWLRTLPLIEHDFLENLGKKNTDFVEIGDGYACCMKIQSYNHHSAIEPYRGAAFGVGDIMRDLYTQGARPLAQLNSLRLGSLDNDRTKWLLRRIVKGIGDYSNAFGVPVVGGEVYFEECYQTNPIVNAMSVGVVKNEEIISAKAIGDGNSVYLIGSLTGKDSIPLISRELDLSSAFPFEKIPATKIGDPFIAKLLLESSRDVIKTGVVIGMQDLGIGGLVCAASEMSFAGKHGMNLFLDRVPLQFSKMSPWEIIVSETSERLLMIVEKGNEENIESVFERWDLNCVKIGEVISDDVLNFYWNNEIIAKVPASSLVVGGAAPVYEREYSEPKYYKDSKKFDVDSIEIPNDMRHIAKIIVSHPNIASKRWIYQQYDSMIQSRNLTSNQPSDAAIIAIKNSEKAIAMTMDCNARYVYADPYIGVQIAVAEAARNIVCSGASPKAITNCLNYGNPYNPEVYWQFVKTIQGITNVCNSLNIPIAGGNVSFYNQSTLNEDKQAVYPTPIIGMIGMLSDKSFQMTLDFKNKQDLIFLIGKNIMDLASSQYLSIIHNVKLSPPPYFNLEEEELLQVCITNLIQERLIISAHDVSDGGVFVALLESTMVRDFGFDINTDPNMRLDSFLFGEAQGRVIVSVNPDRAAAFLCQMKQTKVPVMQLGYVSECKISVNGVSFGLVSDYKNIYHNSIAEIMKGEDEMDVEEDFL